MKCSDLPPGPAPPPEIGTFWTTRHPPPTCAWICLNCASSSCSVLTETMTVVRSIGMGARRSEGKTGPGTGVLQGAGLYAAPAAGFYGSLLSGTDGVGLRSPLCTTCGILVYVANPNPVRYGPPLHPRIHLPRALRDHARR